MLRILPLSDKQDFEVMVEAVKRGFQPERLAQGLEVSSIRHIQWVGYGVLEFLGVGTTFDIFQNIHILFLEYGVLILSGYGVLILTPLWSLAWWLVRSWTWGLEIRGGLELVDWVLGLPKARGRGCVRGWVKWVLRCHELLDWVPDLGAGWDSDVVCVVDKSDGVHVNAWAW
ncbi:hypothetical protein Tco_0389305 [Tanacetum coccineum]